MSTQKIVKKSQQWHKHGKHDRAAHWWLIRERERAQKARRRVTEWFASIREAIDAARRSR
jgi:hypothetical protein